MKRLNNTPRSTFEVRGLSIVVPILISILVPILLFSQLNLFHIVGSILLLLVSSLTIVTMKFEEIPKRDIQAIWVLSLLYNVYLLSYAFF